MNPVPMKDTFDKLSVLTYCCFWNIPAVILGASPAAGGFGKSSR